MATEGEESLTGILIMVEAVGEKMVHPIRTFHGHEEHFRLEIADLFLAIRLVVNVQGKTRIFQSGPWMMTLMVVYQLAEHLTRQVRITTNH